MKYLMVVTSLVTITGCTNLNKTYFDKVNYNDADLSKDIDDCKDKMRGGIYGSDNMPSISFASGPYLTCMQSKGYTVVSYPSDTKSPDDERCVQHSN
jgi:hypothetical protein